MRIKKAFATTSKRSSFKPELPVPAVRTRQYGKQRKNK